MTKKSLKAEVNSFSKGLITEASPLNFPENAASAIDNFVLKRDGTIDRRLGLDIEPGGEWKSWGTGLNSYTTATPFKWAGAGGNVAINLLVVQVGSLLQFHDVNEGPVQLSTMRGSVTIDIPVQGATLPRMTVVNGKLIVVTGSSNISVVSYNSIADTFSVRLVRIKVRDIWGVEELGDVKYETDIQYRGGLDIYHNYNLYNQSWGIPRTNSAGTTVDAIKTYSDGLGTNPSNSELVWTGMYYQPGVGGAAPFERQYPNSYKEAFGASPKASQGYFVIDLFNRGSSRKQALLDNYAKYPQALFGTSAGQVAGLKTDVTYGGVTVVSEFAGRAFFAGFHGAIDLGDQRSPELGNHIAFSQLVRKTDDLTKCYQQGDPTSRDSADLVDTDGGIIRVAGATQITGMVPLATSLIIFASNGVWALSGGSDYGFSATNYKIDKITNFGTLPPDIADSNPSSSIVTDGARVYYWSTDGIYTIGRDQMGSWSAQNITQQTIQTLYDSISTYAKSTVKGVYEVSSKRIRWLYKEPSAILTTISAREIVMDLNIGAFYTTSIKSDPQNTIVVVAPFASTSFPSADEGRADVRYLCIRRILGQPAHSMGIATFNNKSFKDWVSYDNIGIDANAVLATGDITAGDSSVVKQVPYLVLHFMRTENGADANAIPLNQSGCLVRSQWDWANGEVSNKWSPSFQGYRYRQAYLSATGGDYDTGFKTITTRNKLRGRGKAFSLRMDTEPGKDCQIIGWSLSLNGNAIT